MKKTHITISFVILLLFMNFSLFNGNSISTKQIYNENMQINSHVSIGIEKIIPYKLRVGESNTYYEISAGITDIIKSSTGDYIISSLNRESSYEDARILVKLNSSGSEVWTKTNSSQISYSLLPASDGSFFSAGYIDLSEDTGYPKEMLSLARVSSEGENMWTKTYDLGGTPQRVFDLLKMDNSSFLMLGYVEKNNDKDMFLMRVDSGGNLIWSKIYSDDKNNSPTTVIKTLDGGFLLTSTSTGGIMTIKTDSDGTEEWRVYYDDYLAYPGDVLEIPNEGYIVVGDLWNTSYWDRNFENLILKYDFDGNLLYNNSFGDSESQEPVEIFRTEDGGLLIFGYDISSSAWIMKTDNEGNLQWNQTYGVGDEEYRMGTIKQIDKNHFVAGGFYRADNYMGTLEQMWFITFEIDDNTIIEESDPFIRFNSSNFSSGFSIVQFMILTISILLFRKYKRNKIRPF